MNLYFFFKNTQYSRFEYKPRYYDPQKEQREERIKRIKFGREAVVKNKGSQILGKFTGYYEKNRKKEKIKSTKRLIIFMIIAIILWFFIEKYYDIFMEKLLILLNGTAKN